eukprot:13606243-Alexandrium_andersonii.AAC.1
MSASLVGSEMCIRDRKSSVGVTHAAPAPASAQTFRSSTWNARMPCYRSVSYTHLTLPTICSV